MTDHGVVVLVAPAPISQPIAYAVTMRAAAFGAMQTGPVTAPKTGVAGYSLAGTYTPPPPEPCPECPELPAGVIWSPGGRFGQERP